MSFVNIFQAERMEEKLHKRTTVRMGIRVVQRAFAPPSPYRYSPGTGKTSKEQAKINRKALLFGCKSAPIENRFFPPQGIFFLRNFAVIFFLLIIIIADISRSADTVYATRHELTEPEPSIRTTHSSMPECCQHGMDISTVQVYLYPL